MLIQQMMENDTLYEWVVMINLCESG